MNIIQKVKVKKMKISKKKKNGWHKRCGERNTGLNKECSLIVFIAPHHGSVGDRFFFFYMCFFSTILDSYRDFENILEI